MQDTQPTTVPGVTPVRRRLFAPGKATGRLPNGRERDASAGVGRRDAHG
jgi:hypothetical protein